MRTEHKRACKRSSQESAATFATRSPGDLELYPWHAPLIASFEGGVPLKDFAWPRGRVKLVLMPSAIALPTTMRRAIEHSRLEAERAYAASVRALQRQADLERFVADTHGLAEAGQALPKITRRG